MILNSLRKIEVPLSELKLLCQLDSRIIIIKTDGMIDIPGDLKDLANQVERLGLYSLRNAAINMAMVEKTESKTEVDKITKKMEFVTYYYFKDGDEFRYLNPKK